MFPTKSLLGLTLASCLLTACSGTTPPTETSSGSESPAPATSAATTSEMASDAASEGTAKASDTATAYPLTYMSCGHEQTVTDSPKKVVSIQLSTLPTMVDLGLEDRVVGVAQIIPEKAYPAEMDAKLRAMPQLSYAKTSGGTVELSMEAIHGAQADMVFGLEKDLDYNALAEAKIPSYTQKGNCLDTSGQDADIQDVFELYDEVAKIFNVPEAAAKAKADLEQRLAATKTNADAKAGTAVFLYVTPGETELWTYGKASMTDVIMEESGLTNLYADNPQRVFKVGAEDILAKDPDYVVLVNIGHEEAATIEAFKGIGSLGTLSAVTNNKVTYMPYAWADPASSLVVNGIEQLSAFVKDHQ